ncbi:MAG: metallophosphoesterase [Acidobacteria bacterium]|nr:metallophosphoesterase [Acidobacteriota bacterium]
MRLQFLVFFTVLLVLLGGTGAYLALRSMALLPWLGRHPAWVWGCLAVTVLLIASAPVLHRSLPSEAACRMEFLYWVSYGLFGLVSTFLVYLLAADLLQALARAVLGAPPWAGGFAWLLAAALALGSNLLGLAAVLRPVPLEAHDIHVPGLAPDLEGFRIVQLSDLHVGPFSRADRLDELCAQVNALEPDLVAVTGDLVDGEADGARDKVARLGALRARHGVHFVTGNHEYYSGVGPWIQELRGLGWRVLMNEHALLRHGQADLAVAGMPDPTGRRAPGGGPDLARALAGVPPGAFKLLLFHPPSGVEAAEAAGVQLQLSGHTHAGQYFPWSLLVQRLWRYAQGLHRVGDLWIHTSRGTGFWGPPNRFLVPPELTLLVLRRG